MASGSSSSAPTQQRAHYSGLWIGQAVPDESLASEIPVNPIKWSLSLLSDQSGCSVGAFGAGFFDDAGDLPGQPVLFFILQGTFDQAAGKVSLKKSYTSRLIPEELVVNYEGALKIGDDGQPFLSGKWTNTVEGSHGVFACRLEE